MFWAGETNALQSIVLVAALFSAVLAVIVVSLRCVLRKKSHKVITKLLLVLALFESTLK